MGSLVGLYAHTRLRLDSLSGINWPHVVNINQCYGQLLYGRLTQSAPLN